MVDQSPSPELILQAIEAHLAPTIHFKFLPRALDIIAHAALLATKLSDEISRILESDALVIKQGYEGLGTRRKEALERMKIEAEEASASLWQVSVQIRLHHVAAVLAPDKKFSSKILSLIECYFPEQSNVIGSSSTEMYKSSKLFIRAMPTYVHHEHQDAVHLARIWYSDASDGSPDNGDERGTRHVNARKENAARLAEETINSARKIVDCIRQVEELLAEEMTDASTDEVVKEELEPGIRESRSPSPGHLARIPQLIFTRTKKRKSSTRTSLTPATPTIQSRPPTQPRLANPLGSERTTSLMETEAILDMDMSMDDIQSNDDVREVLKRGEEKPTLPAKPKKRSRPSFPPREGPDFTKPLPRPAPRKKLRTFTTNDLKR